MAKGTYVALRVLDPANTQIYNHCGKAGISVKKSLFERRLHTTLIYSRVHNPNLVTKPENVYICTFAGYDVFDTSVPDQKALVMRLDAPAVEKRHEFLMKEYGLSYDHKSFKPHITVTYNYCGGDISKLLPYQGIILLGEEYMEDMDLDWGK